MSHVTYLFENGIFDWFVVYNFLSIYILKKTIPIIYYFVIMKVHIRT